MVGGREEGPPRLTTGPGSQLGLLGAWAGSESGVEASGRGRHVSSQKGVREAEGAGGLGGRGKEPAVSGRPSWQSPGVALGRSEEGSPEAAVIPAPVGGRAELSS